MIKALITYHSKTGTTEKLANIINDELKSNNINTTLKKIEALNVNELIDYDLIIIGSPCYYGTMAAEIKSFLDKSVKLHGKLDGKLGGAFATAANVGGGAETTILDILKALMIHGMLVKGIYSGSHYGAMAISEIKEKDILHTKQYARELAETAKKLFENKSR